MRIINTDRLYLRPMADGEWDKFIAHVFDVDEVYIRFQGRLIRGMLEKPYSDSVIYYTIMLPFTRDMIGYVELTPWTKNISYYIFEEYRYQVFAYEGVEVFMEACKIGFREFGDDEDFLCYDPEREEEFEEKVA